MPTGHLSGVFRMGPPLATGLYGCGSHGPQMIYDDSPFGTGGFSIGNCGPKNPGPGSLSKEKRGYNVGMNQPLDVCTNEIGPNIVRLFVP